VVLNAVRCGTTPSTATAWKALSGATGGVFASIDQSGGMLAVATPMDAQLAALNAELNDTAVAYGTDLERRAAGERMIANAAMAAPIQADSARFRATSKHVDSRDLVAAVESGKADLDALPPEALPAEIRSMPKPAMKAYVNAKAAKRKALTEQVLELSTKRGEYLKAEQSKRGLADGFDGEVQKAISKQASKVGVKY